MTIPNKFVTCQDNAAIIKYENVKIKLTTEIDYDC